MFGWTYSLSKRITLVKVRKRYFQPLKESFKKTEHFHKLLWYLVVIACSQKVLKQSIVKMTSTHKGAQIFGLFWIRISKSKAGSALILVIVFIFQGSNIFAPKWKICTDLWSVNASVATPPPSAQSPSPPLQPLPLHTCLIVLRDALIPSSWFTYALLSLLLTLMVIFQTTQVYAVLLITGLWINQQTEKAYIDLNGCMEVVLQDLSSCSLLLLCYFIFTVAFSAQPINVQNTLLFKKV